jgi:hypothetical protein
MALHGQSLSGRSQLLEVQIMAIIKWQGGVEAVVQVDSATIDTHDAASTYTVTIGDYAISAVGDTDVATTAANLVASLNASTHPYFAAVTWSVPSGSTVLATADAAGVPFLAALSVSGGTGTVTDFSTTTACTGPHHANAVDNWAGGALPSASDEVVIDAGPSILYELDAITSTALARASVAQSFAGKVGLEVSAFATSLDGETLDTDVPEYRGSYLELTADEIVIGEHIGPGSPTGATRIAIEQKKAGASVLDVRNTSATSVNSRPTVRYLAAHASADVVIGFAPGGVGVGVEADETATIGDVTISDTSTASSVYLGPGVTLTTWDSYGGISRIAAAATITAVTVFGGELELTGYDYLITALNVYGGRVTDTHVVTGGADWTTITVYGGELILPYVTARTYTNLHLYGGRVEADWNGVSGTENIGTQTGTSNRRSVEVTDL